MVKPINWGGMLEPYLQPLKERLGILPLGQYEDGSVRLAWPGLLADPVQHGMRAAETPIPPVDDDAAWAAKSRDMFDAAGLATTGALGANMAGGMADNALGSAGAKLTQATQGIRAYHGSPHDFDRFSLDKIGTGEGAQAYGHGLYFADSEDVARSYRDALAKGDPGRMYEVNIKADPNEFIDWSKPISQQSEAVQRAWTELTGNPVDKGGMDFIPRGEDLWVTELPGPFNPQTYRAEMSEKLRKEYGIPGIKYLDGMSRDGGAGTSNYVVFDDQLIDILRKYANAPTGAAIPAGMEASQGEQDQQTLTTANILRLLRGQ